MSSEVAHVSRRQLLRNAGLAGLGLVAAPTLLDACSGGGSLGTGGSKGSGNLILAMTSFGTNEGFDPIINAEISAVTFQALVYDWMAHTDPNTAAAIPGVVSSFQQAPDFSYWDLTIRPGLKFHDGTPATAKDLYFTLQLYLSSAAYDQTLRLEASSVKQLNDSTVRVYVSSPQPTFPYLFTNIPPNDGSLVSSAYYSRVGEAEAVKKPVGVGPWKFVNGIASDSYQYTRYNGYWGPAPGFTGLTTLLVTDTSTQLQMLESGQASMIDVQLSDLANVQQKYTTAPGFAPQVRFDIAGTYDPRAKGMPTTDIRVREALFRAIDYQSIEKSLLYGKALQRMPPRALVGMPQVDADYWSDYIENLWAYDPGKSKQLLAQAGYPDGFSLKVAVWDSGLGEEDLAEAVQSMWQQIGVKASLTLLNSAQYDATQGPIDQWVGQVIWGATRVFGLASQNMSWVWGHTGGQAVACDVRNKAKPKIFLPQLDKLVYEAEAEVNATKRAQIIAEYIKIGLDTYTSYTMGQVPQYMALAKGWKFANLPKIPTASQLTYFTTWVTSD